MDIKQARLLLVDDDPGNLRLLSRMLGEFSNQRLATSGAQALLLARADPPDLVIADMKMPGLSGDQLCSLIRSDPLLADVPVMIVTSDDSNETRIKLLQLGAADFICKPVNPEQLLARAQALLRNAALLKRSLLERAAQRPGPSPSPSPMSSSGPLKLLAVDDDESAIEVLRYSLHGMGEVRAVQSGQEALALADSWLPDIVLLDASMPEMDGFEVCKALKARPAQLHVPVVFVTQFSDPSSETKALELGAADFISKPYSHAVLKARVRNLLDLKRRADAELFAAAQQGHRLATERIGAVIEGASDAIVTVDSTGYVVLMNVAAGRMFHVDHRSAEGRLIAELLGPELAELAELAAAQPAATGQNLSLSRPDGAAVPLEVSVSRVGCGLLELTTLVLRDLSVREQLEAESRARAVAEATSRTRAMMQAYIAHEMGNPLNGMLGCAQLLQADEQSPLTAAQARRVEMIRASGEQLKALMRDLVDLEHLERGQVGVEIAPVDVVAVADRSLRAVSSLAEQGEVELRKGPCSEGLRVMADAQRLQQCLVNLLSNAVKYNRKGGCVELTISPDWQAGLVKISVRDEGLGMDAAQCEHLFEPFNRLGRQHSSTPGTGLGLVVTQQLVAAMGGRIEVTSRIDEGSCFSITLPSSPT